METSAATPTRPPHPAAASPSPSPSSSLRLWRSAAQRNVRNQWSRLSAAKEQWLAAVADGRAHASALVNAHLCRRNMPATDLGVLKDMPGIRDKANSKLVLREEQYSGMLLSAYKEMFSDRQDNLNDSGDGGGAPVFKWFSILEFETLAQELVQMFVSEQKLKRLLLLEFLSIALKEGVELQTSLNWGDELYDGESNELQSIGLQSGDAYSPPENWCAERLGSQRPGNLPLHEVLQVYLTTWHANMNINRSRIGEIFELVEEEMKIKLS
ncbi:Stellacyanin [Zea mays]|uniref:Stellacyanin n=1 Tax=Zea mays TaxID=4577 RepID=A0A1D6PHF0_MAIZE|nr:Stellacyanin [Zea mays]